jgi:hypothetical protein
MRTIIWNFAFEKNTDKQGGNWSVKSIHPAFGKITRYWNVNFQQVQSGKPSMQIILTNASRGASVPMWQSGKNIYASAKYKWVNPDQMILALVHEIGHWLINGGGHIKQPGHVMSEVLGDPYINFSKEDMRWFGGLPWKSNVRPWDAEELNFFRPMRGQALDTPESDVIMNCRSFSIFDLFRGKK